MYVNRNIYPVEKTHFHMQFCTVHSWFSDCLRRLFPHKICTFALYTFIFHTLNLNVFLYLQLRIFVQADTKQTWRKFPRIFSSQCLDWSCIAEKRCSPEKKPATHSNLFSRVELSLGTTICARSLVIWEISCATHTNMKVLTRTLNIGYPGMSTKIPFVSAASQIWYWQMKSCKKKRVCLIILI